MASAVADVPLAWAEARVLRATSMVGSTALVMSFIWEDRR
jgi:hypothetical protein